jgi:hypothetical protein
LTRRRWVARLKDVRFYLEKELRNSVSASDSYRVLLTRARKGMIVFIPRGDPIGEDETRPQSIYDEIANYLISCGACAWPSVGS